MAKRLRENAYMSDLVRCRNACEERKLKATLLRLDYHKDYVCRQKETEKMYFAVNQLIVPYDKPYGQRFKVANVHRSKSAPLTTNRHGEINDVSTRSKSTLGTKELQGDKSDQLKDIFQRKLSVKTSFGQYQSRRKTSKSDFPTDYNNVSEIGNEVVNIPLFTHINRLKQPSDQSSKHMNTSEPLTHNPPIKFFSKRSLSSPKKLLTQRQLFKEEIESNLPKLNFCEREKQMTLSEILSKRKTAAKHNNDIPGGNTNEHLSNTVINTSNNGKEKVRYRETREKEEIREKWAAKYKEMKKQRILKLDFEGEANRTNLTLVKFLPRTKQAQYIKEAQFKRQYLI